MFWGITPSLDLINEYKLLKNDVPDSINVLIVGSADCRHVFKTVALEACVELIARQLLLLNIVLQPPDVVGLAQKTKIFMEIYGNTLVRPTVAKFLQTAATDLIKMITDYDYLKEMMDFVTLDIKYKERDYLENLLKFWCSKDEFDICDSWDRRLRKQLGIRYDSRTGAFDWDLHMRLYDVGGRQICNQEYRSFRSNGVAFSWLESEVSKPNRSMVCVVNPNGTSFVHYGYLGDMQTGPFITFGLECEDEDFLKSMHGQNYFRATDITERNLKQIFHEIQHQREYIHQKTSDNLMGHIVMKEEKAVVDTAGLDFIPRPTKKCFDFEDVTLISLSNFLLMKHKEQYHKFFDCIYFGSTYLKFFDTEMLRKIAKKGSILLVEHQLFVVTNRKKELEEFSRNIEDAVNGLELDKIKFDYQKDPYAKFIIK